MYNEIQKKEYLETLKKNSEATALTFEYSLYLYQLVHYPINYFYEQFITDKGIKYLFE